MYIDIHVHQNYKEKDVLILQNLFPEDTSKIISRNYYSVGLHPWHVTEKKLKEDIFQVDQSASKQNVLAIGEIGLDFKITVPVDLQLEAFRQQIEIAEKHNKPVIIHCVRAYNDLLSIRKNSNQRIPWIIHWFNASLQMAEDLISKNCYLSFGQTLFKEESKAFRAFTKLPVERAFFETDDVGISIKQIYEKASLIKNIPVVTLKKQILSNFTSCFGNIL